MKTCDTCPGGADCAGLNLHPVLLRVDTLFAAGTTDKFDILFALGEEDEALLERFDGQVSKACWTRAALLAIADILADEDEPDRIRARMASSVAAFERFPWQITELVEQAPDLYRAILEHAPDGPFADGLTKRAFVKICKDVAYSDR